MADETTKFESSQALFCAFVDLVGTSSAKKIFFEKSVFPGGNMVFKTYQEFVGYDNNGKPIRSNNLKNKQVITNRNNIVTAFAETDTPGMTLKDMESFLMGSKPWFYSSVVIAVKLITDLHTYTAGGYSLSAFRGLGAKGMGKIDYVRGDPDVMNNIEKIFRICKNNQKTIASVKGISNIKSVPFLDVNKWSPADIYYASNKAKKEIEEVLKEAEDDSYEPTFYYHLNDMIVDLMLTGDLLGVSLKKQPDPSKVKIKLVNFSDDAKKSVLDEIVYDSNNMKSAKVFKPIKRDGKSGKVKVGSKTIRWRSGEVPKDTNTPPRDFTVKIKGGGMIQMRHDPSNNSWKVDFKDKGAGARAGSVTAYDIFCDIWAIVDKGTAEAFRSAVKNAKASFISAVSNSAWKKKGARLKLIPFKGTKMSKPDRFKSSAYDFQKGEISAIHFMNNILPILVGWFNQTGKKHEAKKTAFCRLLFQYVTSRHPSSGKFIIVK